MAGKGKLMADIGSVFTRQKLLYRAYEIDRHIYSHNINMAKAWLCGDCGR